MEWLDNLRKNFFLILLKFLLVLTFFFLIYTFLSFSTIMQRQMGTNLLESADKDLFSITDTLKDDDFSQFRESEQKLATAKKFYDLANASPNFKFLSAFDQAVEIEEFKGDQTFDKSYGTGIEVTGTYLNPLTNKNVFAAKSMQVNRNFFEYYSIQTEGDTSFNWQEVSFEQSELPVLLGANYKGIYKKGDVLAGNWYFREYTFKVIGFLAENTSVFYKNNVNHYLDDYILIPYPEAYTISPANKEFIGMVSFAMLAGDSIVDKKLGLPYFQKQLAMIAKQADFYAYTILGTSTFATEYGSMYELINYNQTILLALFACLLLCMIFIITFLNSKIYQRRALRYYIAYLNGDPFKKMYSLCLSDGVSGDLVMVVAFIALFLVIPNKDMISFELVLLGMISTILLDSLFIYFLLKKDIASNFSGISYRGEAGD